MRALLLKAPGEAILTELEKPAIGPEDVLIHSRAVGICGSDVELYRGTRPAGFYRYPIVLGHEWAGEIVAVGVQVRHLAPGDKVVSEGFLFCVTDLLPAQADIAWYAMRAWIEYGFKDTKRGGWNWHHTKMTDPRRAERHWVVMAVATLWVISVGGEVDATLPESSFETLPLTHIARRLSKQRARQRRISCFARGILTICAALGTGDPLPMGHLLAFPWPCSPPDVSQQAETVSVTAKTYP